MMFTPESSDVGLITDSSMARISGEKVIVDTLISVDESFELQTKIDNWKLYCSCSAQGLIEPGQGEQYSVLQFCASVALSKSSTHHGRDSSGKSSGSSASSSSSGFPGPDSDPVKLYRVFQLLPTDSRSRGSRNLSR